MLSSTVFALLGPDPRRGPNGEQVEVILLADLSSERLSNLLDLYLEQRPSPPPWVPARVGDLAGAPAVGPAGDFAVGAQPEPAEGATPRLLHAGGDVEAIAPLGEAHSATAEPPRPQALSEREELVYVSILARATPDQRRVLTHLRAQAGFGAPPSTGDDDSPAVDAEPAR